MTRFLDTNVLLYAALADDAGDPRARIAQELLHSRDLALSVQVLQEFYVQATRPTRRQPLGLNEAADLASAMTRFPVQDHTVRIFESAIATQERFRISYWDAAIVEAARALGCGTILTEDLQDGMDFDGVSIENPFRGVA